MSNLIQLEGKIIFDPKDKTRKHKKQADWKKIAMVFFKDDSSEFYSWFIRKRYNIQLNYPLRGSHVSFINDSYRDICKGLNIPKKGVDKAWESVKEKYHLKTIKVNFDVDARTNGKYWWLVVPEAERSELQSIRTELGLGKPYFGMHMTIGYANEKNIYHSRYIHSLIKKYGKSYT